MSGSFQTTPEIVLNLVRDEIGTVVDTADITAFARRHNVRPEYVREVLGLFTELGSVEHVRRGLWSYVLETRFGPDRGMDPELHRAYVASRAMGSWSVPSGAWSLHLLGYLAPRAWPSEAVRSCVTPSAAKPGTASTYRPAPHRPTSVAARHATAIAGEPVVPVTRRLTRGTRVVWLSRADRPDLGVHVEAPADALVTMFEHPRVNGGFDLGVKAVLGMLAEVGPGPILEAGRRAQHVATRRRLAYAVRMAVNRTPGVCWARHDQLGCIDDASSVRQSGWFDSCDMVEWFRGFVGVALTRTLTPLDPHRERQGTRIWRFGVLDNREAPLVDRKVTAAPSGASPK